MQLLTLARDLKRRKARERRSQFVAEGVRTVEELLNSTLTVRGILRTNAVAQMPRGAALLDTIATHDIECVEVDEKDFLSAAETDHPQGILAIADVPERALASLAIADPAVKKTRLLVLDAIQDPGNAGTLVRTAAALGVSAVVALPGTADLWNAKSVRSGVGAHFRIPAMHASYEELKDFLAAHEIALWGADAGGDAVDSAIAPERLALAVGNEGAGLSAGMRALAKKIVGLPMSAEVESLNVSVAAGIMLWTLRA
jgi:TrmH family RNA methyltransferase